MESFDLIAVLALLLAVIDFFWHLWNAVNERRVRLAWRINRGASITHPSGYVQVWLTNRGRCTALVESIDLWATGPSINVMSDAEFERVRKTEAKLLGVGGLPDLAQLGRRPGDDEPITIQAFDRHVVEIPSEGMENWPSYRSGVRVRLRDGRCRSISWKEIDKQPSLWRTLIQRLTMSWLTRDK